MDAALNCQLPVMSGTGGGTGLGVGGDTGWESEVALREVALWKGRSWCRSWRTATSGEQNRD